MTSPFTDNADGTREFTCTDCGTLVIQVISDDFDFPVCHICRFIGERPQMPEWVKALLRGKPS
ncbi:hypothetical protein ACVWW6_006002 [Bradyrhizobium sp. USDA 3311]